MASISKPETPACLSNACALFRSKVYSRCFAGSEARILLESHGIPNRRQVDEIQSPGLELGDDGLRVRDNQDAPFVQVRPTALPILLVTRARHAMHDGGVFVRCFDGTHTAAKRRQLSDAG